MSVNRYVNILSSVFTPTNGPNSNAPITLLGVQSMTVSDGSSLLKAAGDGDVGPTTLLIDYIEPTVGLKFEDVTPAAMAPLTGLRGSLAVTIGKAGNTTPIGASLAGGALVCNLNPSLAMTKQISGAYRKFSDCDCEFHGICSSGNPLTWSQTAAVSQQDAPPASESVDPKATVENLVFGQKV